MEERVDHPADRRALRAGGRREEVVGHLVAVVQGPFRPVAHHHGLRADRQRPGEHVVLHGGLQVHEHLAGVVVGAEQVGPIVDPGHAPPAAAVEGLHVERVAEVVGDGPEVEGLVVLRGGVGPTRVVDRVLVGHQHGVRHLQPEAHHRAIGGVLLHGLEGERRVEQVDVVHQGDLLEPLARHVVPVREPVDHQVVLGHVAQGERLDGHPLGLDQMVRPAAVGDGPHGPHQGLQRDGPVVLGAEQQADQVALHVGGVRQGVQHHGSGS